jgi:SAM-dependent methyltransferase
MTDPNSAPVTPERILQMAWGFAAPLILESAIKNRVFDVLDEGPKSLAETAKATGASERGLSAIMNALVGFNFLVKDADGKYSLTAESAAFLVSTKPSFQGGFLRHTSVQLIPNWLSLADVVKTGKPTEAVNQQGTGTEFFEMLVPDIFALSYAAAQDLAAHFAWAKRDGAASVLDLGAGSGVWGIAQAQSAPNVTVTAVDWPGVIDITRGTVARFGLADRFTFVAGDLKDADFGSGHSAATVGHILHSEGEERSKKLLKRIFDALAPGGVIAIQEFLVNVERTGPVNGLIFAVNMLVNTEVGGTWSFEEISSWLADVGFADARLLDARGPSPLILATKP